MATKRIEKSDLINPAAIEEVIADVQKLDKALVAVLKSQKALLKENPFKTTEDVKSFSTSVDSIKSSSKALNEVRKEELKLKEQLRLATDDEVKGKLRLQQATKAQKDELKDQLILQNKESGTLEKLAASNRKLRRERQGLNLDTAKGAERLKQINKQLDQNNIRIKTNSDALKKQRMNVGNYATGVQEGITATGLFSQQLFVLQRIQAVITVLTKKQTVETEALAVAQTTAATSSGIFSKALRILKIALISTGIGAIIVALGALGAAFFSTQRGADALTRVITPLQVIFEKFVGFLQDVSFKVFDRLKKAVDNPKEALKDLGDAIVNNVINRFKAIVDLGSAVGKVLKGLFDRDFDAVSEGIGDAANALSTVATGVEGLGDTVKGIVDDIKEGTSIALSEGNKLADLEIKLEQLRIKNTVPLAEQNRLYRDNFALAADQTKSDAERIKSLEKAREALIEANRLRKEEINAELAIAELKASFNDTDREAQLEIEQIKKRILESEESFLKKNATLTSQLSGLEKKSLATRNKSVDISEEEIKLIDRKTVEKQKEHNADLDHIKEYTEKKKKSNEQIAKDAAKAEADRIKRQEETIETANQLIEGTSDALNQVSDKRIEKIDREKEETDKAITTQERRAEQGLSNTLALEQQKAAELEKQRQEEFKKQERRQKILSYLALFTEYAKENPDTAAGKALAQAALAESISGFFYEGTENVGEGNTKKWRNTGKDDYIAALNGGERVITTADNNRLGNITNKELVDIGVAYQKGGLVQAHLNDDRIVGGLGYVAKTIKENQTSIDYDHLGNFITTQIENGFKRVTKHKTTRPRI